MEDWYGLVSQNVQLLISCRDAGAMSVSCCANTTETTVLQHCYCGNLPSSSLFIRHFSLARCGSGQFYRLVLLVT